MIKKIQILIKLHDMDKLVSAKILNLIIFSIFLIDFLLSKTL